MTSTASPTDALLILVQRISDAQVQQGLNQVKQNEDQHAIRLTLATLNARLEPLTSLIPDLAALRLASQHHQLQLEQHEACFSQMRPEIDALKSASAARSGWEGFGGKLLYILGGAVIAAAVVLFVPQRARAAAPVAVSQPINRAHQAANEKCWAVPAKAPPKWLYL